MVAVAAPAVVLVMVPTGGAPQNFHDELNSAVNTLPLLNVPVDINFTASCDPVQTAVGVNVAAAIAGAATPSAKAKLLV